jgi:hypothetical protein
MKKEGLKEIARDLIALGGIPFFLLVVARLLINPDYPYLAQIIFAGILFLILKFLFKSNIYSGLGIVLLFFISNYYQDLKFAIFATLAYILLIASLIYLKKNNKEIFKGILFGIISSVISYFSVKIFFGF